jgi:hypothetical protein
MGGEFLQSVGPKSKSGFTAGVLKKALKRCFGDFWDIEVEDVGHGCDYAVSVSKETPKEIQSGMKFFIAGFELGVKSK